MPWDGDPTTVLEDASSAGDLNSGNWATWANSAPLQKSGGSIIQSSFNAYGGSRYAGASLGEDFKLLFVLAFPSSAMGGSNYFGLAYCCTAEGADAGDYYIVQLSAGTMTLRPVLNGADQPPMDTWSYSWNANDRIGIKKVGDEHEVYVGPDEDNMTLVANGTDSSFASGQWAIDIFDSGAADVAIAAVLGDPIVSGGDPPVNTVVPAITGVPAVGQTLACSTGTWDNGPDSYAYQWDRDGTPISGATASTHDLEPEDAGALVSCNVTAENEAGTDDANSNAVRIAGSSRLVLVDGELVACPHWTLVDGGLV